MHIVNTRADLDALRSSNPVAHEAFIANLKGSLTRLTDIREYPAGYDRNLQSGDEGYLAPQIGEVPDDTTAARFGYSREQLEVI